MAESDVQQLLQSVQRLFALRRSIGRRIDSQLSTVCFGVLGALARCGEQRLGDLAAALHVHPSAVTRQIADLELRGCIVRRSDPDDRRSSFVALTDAGAEELHGYYRVAGKVLSDVLDGWNDDDVRSLSELIQRLVAEVETKALSAA